MQFGYRFVGAVGHSVLFYQARASRFATTVHRLDRYTIGLEEWLGRSKLHSSDKLVWPHRASVQLDGSEIGSLQSLHNKHGYARGEQSRSGELRDGIPNGDKGVDYACCLFMCSRRRL